jgi:small subunit ribosomal protein S6e|tara:strand:+ start:2393 stop:2932 length:540 start_codon:yes stop_codon:yes gene_type:complete
MAKEFKMTVAVGNPGTKKTYKVELDMDKAQPLFGKKIGQEFNGESIGLDGYKLKVTGGSDLSGFPMRRDIEGIGKRRVLLNVGSLGFRSRRYHSIPEGEGAKKKLKETRKGERRRKSIRGNTISDAIRQVNCVVTKSGKATPEKLLGLEAKPEGEATEEAPTEEKAEVKEETKAEEKAE